MPVALAPDDEIRGQCFSGTAISEDDRHLLIYTVHNDGKEEQAVEIGNGVEYKSISNSPVIKVKHLPKGFDGIDFRDPKIWKEDENYYCIVSAKNDRGLGSLLIFESSNLIDWKYDGIFFENDGNYGKMWECPDFFKFGDKYAVIVSVMEMQARGREYFNGHQVIYFIGDYDRESHKFIPVEKGKTMDFGFDYYAPQSLYAAGKPLSIAWLHDWGNDLSPEGSKWCGQMTYPRVLELKENLIYQMPDNIIKNHYENEYRSSFTLEKNKVYTDKNLDSRVARLDLDIINTDAGKCAIYLAADDRYNSFIKINMKKKK